MKGQTYRLHQDEKERMTSSAGKGLGPAAGDRLCLPAWFISWAVAFPRYRPGGGDCQVAGDGA